MPQDSYNIYVWYSLKNVIFQKFSQWIYHVVNTESLA